MFWSQFIHCIINHLLFVFVCSILFALLSTSWHVSDSSELLLRSLLLFFVLLLMHHNTHSDFSEYSKPLSHHIRTHPYLLIASIKSHIKIKDCRGPLFQLFLQQSFNSIQRLYIIGMHVPDQVVFIVTSAVWSYHLGGYWWQNKPLCTFGIRLGMRFCCTFTPAVVEGEGQVLC